jgi:transcriptional regulator with XRE-family HTH domain
MNTKLKKIAGQQLQLLRLEKNLTQEQMSEKLNLSTSAYCKIEYGETDLTLTRLDKIAKVLGISALSLFSHIDKSMNPDTDNSCKNSNNDSTDDLNDLRELIKANTRIIDLLSKRIDLLEQKL